MFGRMNELPGLLVSDGLPVGLGIAASALTRAAAYNMVGQTMTGQPAAPWVKIGYDLTATVVGLIGMSATDGVVQKFFIGFAGFAAIGFFQAVTFRLTGFDILGSMHHRVPADPIS